MHVLIIYNFWGPQTAGSLRSCPGLCIGIIYRKCIYPSPVTDLTLIKKNAIKIFGNSDLAALRPILLLMEVLSLFDAD